MVNNGTMPMASCIDGTTGSDSIAELWRKHYENIFTCVTSEVPNIGVVPHNENVFINHDAVSHAIDNMALNKACGHDHVAAEHLKHASHKVSVLLTLCFSGLLMHGILPKSMMAVILVPVVKNKTGKLSSIDNYRPIALASTVSKVFECILLERLSEYIQTTDNQFGFKKKHGTDLCIYLLKDVVSQYKRSNSTVFMCFWMLPVHLIALVMANCF